MNHLVSFGSCEGPPQSNARGRPAGLKLGKAAAQRPYDGHVGYDPKSNEVYLKFLECTGSLS